MQIPCWRAEATVLTPLVYHHYHCFRSRTHSNHLSYHLWPRTVLGIHSNRPLQCQPRQQPRPSPTEKSWTRPFVLQLPRNSKRKLRLLRQKRRDEWLRRRSSTRTLHQMQHRLMSRRLPLQPTSCRSLRRLCLLRPTATELWATSRCFHRQMHCQARGRAAFRFRSVAALLGHLHHALVLC